MGHLEPIGPLANKHPIQVKAFATTRHQLKILRLPLTNCWPFGFDRCHESFNFLRDRCADKYVRTYVLILSTISHNSDHAIHSLLCHCQSLLNFLKMATSLILGSIPSAELHQAWESFSDAGTVLSSPTLFSYGKQYFDLPMMYSATLALTSHMKSTFKPEKIQPEGLHSIPRRSAPRSPNFRFYIHPFRFY